MSTACYAMVRGSVARFTLTDKFGAPIIGPKSTLTTKGIAVVAIDETTESLGSDLLRNDSDDPRILIRGVDQTIRYAATITLTNVDPDLVAMLTSQQAVADYSGNIVGNDVKTRVTVANFAMEIWSKLEPGSGHKYGYTLFPRLRGGRFGGFSFSDGAVTFQITGASTTRMSKWGLGPYLLVNIPDFAGWDNYPWDEFPWDTEPAGSDPSCDDSEVGPDDFPQGLPTPVGPNTHWLNFLLDQAPTPTCGAEPLVLPNIIIDGGDATTTTDDVIDGQFVDTSDGILDGGLA